MDAKIFLFLVCAAVCAVGSVSGFPDHGSKHCTDNSRTCHDRSECCSGCCSLGACASFDRCSSQSQGECATHYCPPDKECYMQVVQSLTAPGPPIPMCRPKINDYDNYE